MTAPADEAAAVAATATATATVGNRAATTGDATAAQADRRVDRALRRYRVFAYVVGVGLIALVFVGMPLRYLADIPEVSQTISPVHGLMYIIYLVLTVDLALKARFSAKRTVAIMLAGTIPFLSFVAERKVSRLVRPAA